MVTAWQRLGHQVTIFSPSTTEGLAHYQGIEQLQTVPTPLPALFPEMAHELDAVDQLLGRPSRVKQDLRNFWYNRTFYDAVAPHLQTGRYDFVYERYTLFHYAGIALAKAHRLPHVLEVNAPLCYEKEKMAGLEMKGLAETLEQRIFTESDRVAVVSETLRDFVATRGVPAAQILLTPNGIDPESFHAAPETAAQVRRRYQIPTDQCVIGFVGSLKSWHGTNTLIDALAHLRRYPVHLLLVGDGPEKARLMAQVAALDLNALVTFTGDVTHDQIPAHIAAMDITCAPYGEQENFYFSPIKIFEYMAVGKAVVAGNIGQVANLVQHEENGLPKHWRSSSSTQRLRHNLVQPAVRGCDKIGRGSAMPTRSCRPLPPSKRRRKSKLCPLSRHHWSVMHDRTTADQSRASRDHWCVGGVGRQPALRLYNASVHYARAGTRLPARHDKRSATRGA
jgi:glycosyltransferase involved in cell wall biosynthesis